jgi:hypothetical protein
MIRLRLLPRFVSRENAIDHAPEEALRRALAPA